MSAKKNLTLPINHSDKLLQKLKLILDKNSLCDVVLVAGEDKQRISAHRVILSATSDYFEAMFLGSMMESKQKEVEINEIKGETLRTLVTYCYTGKFDLSVDNAERILTAAHFLQLDAVVNQCAEFLKYQLNPSNCLGIKYMAEKYDCFDLEDSAHTYICEYFDQVTKSEEFHQLSVDQLVSLISKDDVFVESEEDIFNCLMSWVRHDEANRKKNIPNLLLHVRMPIMDTKFIFDHLKNLCTANGCPELFIEAYEWKLLPSALPKIDPNRIKPRYSTGGCLLLVGSSNIMKLNLYSPKSFQRHWTSIKNMTIDRTHMGIAVWKEKLVIVGGMLKGVLLNTVSYWDVELKSWKDLNPLNTPRRSVGVAVLGDSLYVVGGFRNNTWDKVVHRLDSITRSWQSVAPLPFGVPYPELAVYGGCIYVVGKFINAQHLRYNPHTDEWKILVNKTSDIPESLLVINDDLYGIKEHVIYKYEKETNNWLNHFSNGEVEVACAFNDRFLGFDYEEDLLFKEFDPIKKGWKVLSTLPRIKINRFKFIYIPAKISKFIS